MLKLKVLNSLTPVFADKELEAGELTKLFACKNQTANFQIAFKLAEDTPPCVPFFLKIKSELPISLYYVNNVPVIHTATLKNAPPIGLYPDVLLPKSVNPNTENHAYPWSDVVIEKGEKTQLQAYSDSWQAVWLSVNENGKSLKSGSYTVAVDAYNGKNEHIGSASVEVEILSHSLPRQKL